MDDLIASSDMLELGVEVQRIRDFHAQMDTNKDSFVDPPEWLVAMDNPEGLDAVLQSRGLNTATSTATVSPAEIVNTIAASLAYNNLTPDAGYDAFDLDEDGKVTLKDLAGAVEPLSLTLKPQDIEALFNEMGGQQNGYIARDVWVEMIEQADSEKVLKSRGVIVDQMSEGVSTGIPAGPAGLQAALNSIAAILRYNDYDTESGFDAFDVDEDGFLSLDDLRQSVADLQLQIQDADILEVFDTLGPNQGGKVSRESWVRVMESADGSELLRSRGVILDGDGGNMPRAGVAQGDGVSSTVQNTADIIAAALAYNKLTADEGYDSFDVDQDGVLSYLDLEKAAEILRLDVNAQDLQAFWAYMTPGSSREIERSLWVNVITSARASDVLKSRGVATDPEASSQDAETSHPAKPRPVNSEQVQKAIDTVAAALKYNNLDFDQGYESFDADEDGQLSQQDLETSIQDLQLDLDAASAIALFRHLDPESIGFIRLENWRAALETAEADTVLRSRGVITSEGVVHNNFARADVPQSLQDAIDVVAAALVYNEISIEDGFDTFDADEDGVLSLADMKQVVQTLQLEITEESVEALFNFLLKDSASITLSRWVEVMSTANSEAGLKSRGLTAASIGIDTVRPVLEEIAASLKYNELTGDEGYDAFDVDEDGFVSKDDLTSAITSLNLNIDGEDATKLFDYLEDQEKRGFICRESWCEAIFKVYDTADQVLRSRGVEVSGETDVPQAPEGSQSLDVDKAQGIVDQIAASLAFNQVSVDDGYNAFDADEDGVVSQSDLEKAFRSLELDISQEDLHLVYSFLEPDGGTHIARDKWVVALSGAKVDDVLRSRGVEALPAPTPAPAIVARDEKPNAEVQKSINTIAAAMRYNKLSGPDSYNAVDVDEDGKVSYKDLQDAVIQLDLELSTDQVQAVLEHLDQDRSGVIGEAAWINAMGDADIDSVLKSRGVVIPEGDFQVAGTAALPVDPSVQKSIDMMAGALAYNGLNHEEGFAAVDIDDDGKISLEDLSQTVKSLQLDLGPGDTTMMHVFLDKAGTGMIAQHDWVHAMATANAQEVLNSRGVKEGDASDRMHNIPNEIAALLKFNELDAAEGYKEFDMDEDEKISLHDMQQSVKKFQLDMDEKNLESWFADIAGGKTGYILLEDWVRVLAVADPSSVLSSRGHGGVLQTQGVATAGTTTVGKSPEEALDMIAASLTYNSLSLGQGFDSFDADEDGLISLKDLDVVVKQLELELSDAEVRGLHDFMDMDKDGMVSRQEWEQVLAGARGNEVLKSRGVAVIDEAAEEGGEPGVQEPAPEAMEAPQEGRKLSRDEAACLIQKRARGMNARKAVALKRRRYGKTKTKPKTGGQASSKQTAAATAKQRALMKELHGGAAPPASILPPGGATSTIQVETFKDSPPDVMAQPPAATAAVVPDPVTTIALVEDPVTTVSVVGASAQVESKPPDNTSQVLDMLGLVNVTVDADLDMWKMHKSDEMLLVSIGKVAGLEVDHIRVLGLQRGSVIAQVVFCSGNVGEACSRLEADLQPSNAKSVLRKLGVVGCTGGSLSPSVAPPVKLDEAASIQVADLQSRLQAALDTQKELQVKLHEAESKAASSQSAMGDLLDGQALQDRIAALEAQIASNASAAKDDELDKTSSRVKMLELDLEGAKAKLAETEARMSDVEVDKKAREDKIAALEAQIASDAEKHDELDKTSSRVKMLELDLEGAKAKLAETEVQLHDATQSESALKVETAALKAKIEQLELASVSAADLAVVSVRPAVPAAVAAAASLIVTSLLFSRLSVEEGFAAFDSDSDGVISGDDIIESVSKFSLAEFQETLVSFHAAANVGKDGKLTIAEWHDALTGVDIAQVLKANGNVPETLSATEAAGMVGAALLLNRLSIDEGFEAFDADADGKISLDDLSKSVEKLELGLKDDEIKALLTELDQNRDGFVDRSEWMDGIKASDLNTVLRSRYFSLAEKPSPALMSTSAPAAVDQTSGVADDTTSAELESLKAKIDQLTKALSESISHAEELDQEKSNLASALEAIRPELEKAVALNDDVEKQMRDAEDRAHSLQAQLNEATSRISDFESSKVADVQAFQEAKNTFQNLLNDATDKNAKMKETITELTQQVALSQIHPTESLDKDIAKLEDRVNSSTEQFKASEARSRALDSALMEAKAKIKELEARLAEKPAVVETAAVDTGADAKEEISRLLKQIDDLTASSDSERASAVAAKARVEQLELEAANAQSRLDQLSSVEKELTDVRLRLEQEQKQTLAKVDESKGSKDELEKLTKDVQTAHEREAQTKANLEQMIAELKENIKEGESRLKDLEREVAEARAMNAVQEELAAARKATVEASEAEKAALKQQIEALQSQKQASMSSTSTAGVEFRKNLEAALAAKAQLEIDLFTQREQNATLERKLSDATTALTKGGSQGMSGSSVQELSANVTRLVEEGKGLGEEARRLRDELRRSEAAKRDLEDKVKGLETQLEAVQSGNDRNLDTVQQLRVLEIDLNMVKREKEGLESTCARLAQEVAEKRVQITSLEAELQAEKDQVNRMAMSSTNSPQGKSPYLGDGSRDLQDKLAAEQRKCRDQEERIRSLEERLRSGGDGEVGDLKRQLMDAEDRLVEAERDRMGLEAELGGGNSRFEGSSQIGDRDMHEKNVRMRQLLKENAEWRAQVRQLSTEVVGLTEALEMVTKRAQDKDAKHAELQQKTDRILRLAGLVDPSMQGEGQLTLSSAPKRRKKKVPSRTRAGSASPGRSERRAYDSRDSDWNSSALPSAGSYVDDPSLFPVVRSGRNDVGAGIRPLSASRQRPQSARARIEMLERDSAARTAANVAWGDAPVSASRGRTEYLPPATRGDVYGAYEDAPMRSQRPLSASAAPHPPNGAASYGARSSGVKGPPMDRGGDGIMSAMAAGQSLRPFSFLVRSVQDGEVTTATPLRIIVEFCNSEHYSRRHDIARYQHLYERVASAIYDHLRGRVVLLSPNGRGWNKGSSGEFEPRGGAFEVFVEWQDRNGDHHMVVLFSKLETMRYPNPSNVAARLRVVLAGGEDPEMGMMGVVGDVEALP